MHGRFQLWELAALALVGAAAGFVNTVAGAGSLLSLRALMLLGLPATLANGTNRVPIVAQSLAASLGFSRAGKLPRATILHAAWPACVGAAAGAVGASYVPERPMRIALIVVLFGVGLLGLRRPKRSGSHARPAELDEAQLLALVRSPKIVAWLFFAGAYGGFLQAGVGLILLHALSTVGGLDLVRSNALKVVVVAIFSVIAAGVFIARGQVLWTAALVMSLGSVIGARLAVAYAISWAERLKVLVVVVDLAACLVLVAQEL